jgi:glyoxylase-like metal-dependent hydrolase (beta-lactamase superfamily II)
MQVIPGLHQITLRCVNIFLVVEDKLTLIDTGFRGSGKHIARYIANMGRSVDEIGQIIVTHNHLDHVGGLPELKRMAPQASIALHQDDLNPDNSQLPYPRLVLMALKLPLASLYRPLVYARPEDIDIKLAGDETLSPLGGLRVIPAPGHTPGGVSLYSPGKKVLFVGDMLNNRHRDLIPPDRFISLNYPEAVESVKKLAQLDFDVLCCGHGRPIVGDAGDYVRQWIKRRGL